MSKTKQQSESILLAGHQVHWLDRSTQLTEDTTRLHSDEQTKAATIKSPTRRAEFERSRLLLRQLTGWQQPFLPDPSNRPSWPEGLCGSLSHKNGHVAAVISQSQTCSAIGLDCEDAEKDIRHLIDKVCTAREKKILEDLTRVDAKINLGSLVSLIFCAKEALFKCHYPLGLKMFWFHDAEADHLDVKNGTLTLRVLIDTSPRTPAGFLTPVSFVQKTASDTAYWLAICCLPAASVATASATTGTT